jgi:hypothetical protein
MLPGAGSADQLGRRGRKVRRKFGRRHDLEDYRSCRYALLPNGPSSEQAIAATKRRLQQPSIRAKRLADRGYVNLKRTFLDDRAHPNPAHDLVLGDELTGRPSENLDDVEGAAPQRDRSSMRPQFTPCEVQLPRPRIVIQSSALCRQSRDPAVLLGNFRIFLNYAKEWMRSPGEDSSSGGEPCQPNRAISATTSAFTLKLYSDRRFGNVSDRPV